MKYKFKIGDVVKVIRKKSSTSKVLNGRVGKIVKVCDDYCILDIEKGEMDCGGVWFDEIELHKPSWESRMKRYKND